MNLEEVKQFMKEHPVKTYYRIPVVRIFRHIVDQNKDTLGKFVDRKLPRFIDQAETHLPKDLSTIYIAASNFKIIHLLQDYPSVFLHVWHIEVMTLDRLLFVPVEETDKEILLLKSDVMKLGLPLLGLKEVHVRFVQDFIDDKQLE